MTEQEKTYLEEASSTGSVEDVIRLFVNSTTGFYKLDKNVIDFASFRKITLKLAKIPAYYGIILHYERFLLFCSFDAVNYALFAKYAVTFIYGINSYLRVEPFPAKKVSSKSASYAITANVLKKKGIQFGEQLLDVNRYSIDPLIHRMSPRRKNSKKPLSLVNLIFMFVYDIRGFISFDKNLIDWRELQDFVNKRGRSIENLTNYFRDFITFCTSSSFNLNEPSVVEIIEGAVRFINEAARASLPKTRRITMACKTLPTRLIKLFRKGILIRKPFTGNIMVTKPHAVNDIAYRKTVKITNIRTLVLFFYLKPESFIGYDKNEIPIQKILKSIEPPAFREDELYLFDVFLRFCESPTKTRMSKLLVPLAEFFETVMARLNPIKQKSTVNKIHNKYDTILDDYKDIFSRLKRNQIGRPLGK